MKRSTYGYARYAALPAILVGMRRQGVIVSWAVRVSLLVLWIG